MTPPGQNIEKTRGLVRDEIDVINNRQIGKTQKF